MAQPHFRVQALAAKALAEALAGSFSEPYEATAEAHGWRAIVRVEQVASQQDGPLTDCEKDLLELLLAADRPLTGNELLADLERANRIHGESTVRHALASLRKRNRLTLGPGGRGYVATM